MILKAVGKALDKTVELLNISTDIAKQKLDAIATAAESLEGGDNFVYYSFKEDGILSNIRNIISKKTCCIHKLMISNLN